MAVEDDENIGTYIIQAVSLEEVNTVIKREEWKGATFEELTVVTTFGPGHKTIQAAGFKEDTYTGTVSKHYYLLEFYQDAPDLEEIMTLQEAVDMRGTLMHLKAGGITIKEVLAYLGEMKK